MRRANDLWSDTPASHGTGPTRYCGQRAQTEIDQAADLNGGMYPISGILEEKKSSIVSPGFAKIAMDFAGVDPI